MDAPQQFVERMTATLRQREYTPARLTDLIAFEHSNIGIWRARLAEEEARLAATQDPPLVVAILQREHPQDIITLRDLVQNISYFQGHITDYEQALVREREALNRSVRDRDAFLNRLGLTSEAWQELQPALTQRRVNPAQVQVTIDEYSDAIRNSEVNIALHQHRLEELNRPPEEREARWDKEWDLLTHHPDLTDVQVLPRGQDNGWWLQMTTRPLAHERRGDIGTWVLKLGEYNPEAIAMFQSDRTTVESHPNAFGTTGFDYCLGDQAGTVVAMLRAGEVGAAASWVVNYLEHDANVGENAPRGLRNDPIWEEGDEGHEDDNHDDCDANDCYDRAIIDCENGVHGDWCGAQGTGCIYADHEAGIHDDCELADCETAAESWCIQMQQEERNALNPWTPERRRQEHRSCEVHAYPCPVFRRAEVPGTNPGVYQRAVNLSNLGWQNWTSPSGTGRSAE